MVVKSSKRRDPESDDKEKSSSEALPTKRLRVAPDPRNPETLKKRATNSFMGPPPLPKASRGQNAGQEEGPGKGPPASARTQYKTSVPSDLRLPPALVRPPSQVSKSLSFILTPVIPSQSTFSAVGGPQDTVLSWSGAPWLPRATRPQGPVRDPHLGVVTGGRYPKPAQPAEFTKIQNYKKAKAAPPPHEKGMIKTVIGTKNVLQFRATDSLGGRKSWPVISLGKNGPFPRWRLFQHEPELRKARDLELDFIRIHQDKTIIQGLDRDSHPKSNDSSIGLGALYWGFQKGPKDTWGGLTTEQLYEFAYKCLEDALNDYQSRYEMRLLLKQINLSSVANVEDPLPPLPKPPKVTHFGPEAGVAAWPKIPPLVKGVPRYYFGQRYRRPSLAIRGGQNTASVTDWLITRMRYQVKGTFGRPGVIIRSRDPKDKQPPPASAPANSTERDYSEKYMARKVGLKTGGTTKEQGAKAALVVEKEKPGTKVKGDDKEDDVNVARLVTGKGSLTDPSHRDRIVLSSHDLSRGYYSKCKRICENPVERQRYIPAPKSVRRVRTWAGSSIPASQMAHQNWNLPLNRASDRPFSPFTKI